MTDPNTCGPQCSPYCGECYQRTRLKLIKQHVAAHAPTHTQVEFALAFHNANSATLGLHVVNLWLYQNQVKPIPSEEALYKHTTKNRLYRATEGTP